MKNLLIYVRDRIPIKCTDGAQCCVGELEIGNHKESFHMPIDVWSLEIYEQQWKDGIERLKTHRRSCIVLEFQNVTQKPQATLWTLYKRGDSVLIQVNLLCGKDFRDQLTKKSFTPTSCYDFIRPYKYLSFNGKKIEPWKAKLKNILNSPILDPRKNAYLKKQYKHS